MVNISYGDSSNDELTVAVSSSILKPIRDIVKVYEVEFDVKVKVTSASTGKLFLQIKEGAPIDIFLSADTVTPLKLVEDFGNIYETFTYAQGKLCLISDSGKDLIKNILLSKEIKKIAIANPKVAPYGRAAVEFLKSKGIYDNVKDKFVFGDNVGTTASYFKLGVVDAAIISPAVLDKSAAGKCSVVSDNYISHGGVLLNDTNSALSFKEFLFQSKSREIFSSYGFEG